VAAVKGDEPDWLETILRMNVDLQSLIIDTTYVLYVIEMGIDDCLGVV
jgi:hypothetical protein